MTKPFSLAFKQQMISRLIGRDAVSAGRLSREVGIAQQTLSRWLEEARSLPYMAPRKRNGSTVSLEDKVRILSEAGKLAGDELTAWLEREGVSLAELKQWRSSLSDGENNGLLRYIRELEKELARKDKALAEAAALLVLKKKLQGVLGVEDDDTDEESGK